MSYLICLHHCHFQTRGSTPNYLLHPGCFQLRRLTKVDPCVDPRSDHGLGGQAQGVWDIVRQWDHILWLTTLTLGALQLEKWTKTKIQAWYTLSLHLLDITLTLFLLFLMVCLICLLCWTVGFQTFPMLLNNHPAFITNLPTFSKVPTTVANALAPTMLQWLSLGITTVVTGDPFQVCHIWPRPLAGPAAMEVVVGSNPKTSGRVSKPCWQPLETSKLKIFFKTKKVTNGQITAFNKLISASKKHETHTVHHSSHNFAAPMVRMSCCAAALFWFSRFVS